MFIIFNTLRDYIGTYLTTVSLEFNETRINCTNRHRLTSTAVYKLQSYIISYYFYFNIT